MLKKYFKSLLAITLLAILGGFGLLYFQYQQKHPSTDNAYIQAHIVYMAPQIDATAQKVLIKDHQQVKQGQLLITLDPRPFEIALTKAQAS